MRQSSVDKYLADATKRLAAADISTARLDVLVLMEDILGTDRAQLLAHPEQEIDSETAAKLSDLVARRAQHEPLAYIRNKSEFYGREFYIDRHVLEPRPESETMIDLLKALQLPNNPCIIDIGTGSGALAITAKLEIPGATVTATDIDSACLAIAARNASQLDAAVTCVHGTLLEPLPAPAVQGSILLCNLPYVPDTFQINTAAMNEPRLAIFGGTDGLDLYRQLFQQLNERQLAPAFILTEAMPPQHDELKNIALDSGFVLDRSDDFIQVFRMGSGDSAS